MSKTSFTSQAERRGHAFMHCRTRLRTFTLGGGGINITFISSREAKHVYFMSGLSEVKNVYFMGEKATNELSIVYLLW